MAIWAIIWFDFRRPFAKTAPQALVLKLPRAKCFSLFAVFPFDLHRLIASTMHSWTALVPEQVLQFAQTTPLPWLLLTVLAYLAGTALYRRSGGHPLLIPVLTAVALIVVVLLALDVPYATYRTGTRWLELLIGPATVALAVPLYVQRQRIAAQIVPITVALLVGCVVAYVSTMAIAWALGGTWQTVLSLMPKSATVPIALPVSERAGGEPSLTAVSVAITGICGAMLTPALPRLLGVRDEAQQGFALGLSAHAIGTARALQLSPTMGAFCALAMGLNGILTAALMPAFVQLARWLGLDALP